MNQSRQTKLSIVIPYLKRLIVPIVNGVADSDTITSFCLNLGTLMIRSRISPSSMGKFI